MGTMKGISFYFSTIIFIVFSSNYHLTNAREQTGLNFSNEPTKSLRGLKTRKLDTGGSLDNDNRNKATLNITNDSIEKVEIMEDITEEITSTILSNTTNITSTTDTSDRPDINEPTIQERLRKQAQKVRNRFYDLSRSSPAEWTSDKWAFFAGVLIVALILITCCCGFCIRCRNRS